MQKYLKNLIYDYWKMTQSKKTAPKRARVLFWSEPFDVLEALAHSQKGKMDCVHKIRFKHMADRTKQPLYIKEGVNAWQFLQYTRSHKYEY